MLNIETDVLQVEKALSGTSKSLPTIKRQALGIISKGAVKQIKAIIKQTTRKDTGELEKAYRYKIAKDGSQANVFPKALNSDSTIFPKAMTLSYGHEGATKRSKTWRIKALGFIQAGEAWVEAGAYESDLNEMVEKELNKYWG